MPYGVTTAVDSGSATCETFPDFKTHVIDRAKVRILAFLSATDADCTSRVALQAKETIVGIAAAQATFDAAIAAARASGVMIMASGDSGQLRAGDGSTQIHSRPGALLFRIAQPAVAQKFLPDTISSGMDWNSILLPRANMATSMSIFLNLGMPEDQIIERVTSNAARAIKRPQLGTLSEGGVADIAVLEVQEGKFGFLDSGHARMAGTRRFHCALTVRNGIIVWDSEGLSIPDATRAGSYSNFK